ncbi:lytic murein transglycosylase [Phaeospirillum tilakii]|uniref:Lytic transglycosylase domain-containing protein n=1 Tax=Phaeospirillum tilakii TaxID=741673 RepID=A0ABW5CD77_9PROT
MSGRQRRPERSGRILARTALALLTVAGLPGCVGTADADAARPAAPVGEAPAPVVPATAAPVPAPAPPPVAALPDVPPPPSPEVFAAFLDEVGREAVGKGISPATVSAAFEGVRHIDRVIELDRKQPEFTLTFPEYLAKVVNPTRVAEGRRLYQANRDLLAAIERRYGVPARFVVALWGIESNYGQQMGNMSVVASLATLAYDGRRAKYFRGELMQALRILDHGDTTPKAMIGSWAGAMGQCQFMPTTYLRHAVDWDGDGRRDIWTNRADALASAAHYLADEGWRPELGWGKAVTLPAGFDTSLIGTDKPARPASAWARLGIVAADGGTLAGAGDGLRLVRPDPASDAAFLVTENFRTVMKWNRSTFFALAAGHLADRIADR